MLCSLGSRCWAGQRGPWTWVMIPIWGSRRNFQTMPIVASDEITGKKYTERKNLLIKVFR